MKGEMVNGERVKGERVKGESGRMFNVVSGGRDCLKESERQCHN